MKTNYNLAIVKKSNALIESSYKLSANEQKILLVFMSMIKQTDKDFKVYKVSVKKLAEVLDIKTGDIYADVRSIILRLQTKTLSIFREEENTILDTNWLSSAEYYLGKGIIELIFEPKLKPYLLNLKQRFTTYRLVDVTQLKSQFSIRVFELLKQFENIGIREISLQKLREILKISPNQYKLYSNFKRKVLLKAQEELTNKSNLTFDFDEIKEGNKVYKIRFTIIKQQREQASLPLRDIDIEESEEMMNFEKLLLLIPTKYRDKLSVKKLIETYLGKENYDYVARNIIYANDKSNAVNPGKNMSKRSNYRNYLKKALKNDFGLAYIEDLEEKKKEKQLQQKAEENRKKEEARKKIAEEAKEKLDEAIQNYLSSLSKEEHDKLKQEASNRLEGEKKESVLNKKAGSKIILKLEIKQIIKERLFKT